MLRLLLGTCLTGQPIASAHAQDAETEATPNDVTQLERLVVTASSIATDIRSAPASVSVIDRTSLEQKAVVDLSEAIRTVPGVNVGFGSNGTRGISIRGLGSGYSLILVDGKRVNANLTMLRHYNGDLDWVPLEAIERIEVVRGPMSTLYGSDALGGVINIITKKGTDRWSGSVTTEFLQPESKASGATQRLNGYVSGPLIPDVLSFTGFGNISRKKADDPTFSDFETPRGTRDFDLNGRFTWTPSADHVFDLDIGHGQERYDPFDAESERTIKRTTASLRHVGEWDIGTSTVTGFMEQSKNEYDIFDRDGDLIGDGITAKNFALDGKLAMPIDMMWQQDLTVGGEVRYEELNDPANLGGFNSVIGTSGSPIADSFTAALFLEDQIHFTDRFKLTAGARYDYHDYFGSHLSPKAYLNYDLTDAFTIKAGWAQAFKAPNLRQLNPNWVTTSRGRGCGAVGGPCEMVGNPDLQPETSNSFEGGFVYDDGAWQGGLTYFYNLIDDKITSARVPSLITPDGVKFVQQINVDKARSQGLEGFLTIPVHSQISWTNSFTWLFESRNLETGMPLSADPEFSFHTNVAWQATEKLNLSTTLNYYGKQVDYVLAPETLTAQNVDPYFIADVAMKYDFNENFSTKLGVNNVFDSQPKSESNFKENGRTFFVSMTGRF
jgi:outer membrane receptor for ferrienterochelin and colicins